MQVLVEARYLVLEDDHEHEEDYCFDQVAQTHRVLPDLDVELVGHRFILPSARPVKPLPQLVVLLKVQLVRESQVV